MIKKTNPKQKKKYSTRKARVQNNAKNKGNT